MDLILPIALAAMTAGPAPFTDTNFDVRLSPGPRNVGTRAASSGGGELHVQLDGKRLSLQGSYHGLLAAPSTAQLRMGSTPGVRGPKLADLTITPAAMGSLSGSLQLDDRQLAAFRRGGLYVEIDSAQAPEGDLWVWILPVTQ